MSQYNYKHIHQRPRVDINRVGIGYIEQQTESVTFMWGGTLWVCYVIVGFNPCDGWCALAYRYNGYAAEPPAKFNPKTPRIWTQTTSVHSITGRKKREFIIAAQWDKPTQGDGHQRLATIQEALTYWDLTQDNTVS